MAWVNIDNIYGVSNSPCALMEQNVYCIEQFGSLFPANLNNHSGSRYYTSHDYEFNMANILPLILTTIS